MKYPILREYDKNETNESINNSIYNLVRILILEESTEEQNNSNTNMNLIVNNDVVSSLSLSPSTSFINTTFDSSSDMFHLSSDSLSLFPTYESGTKQQQQQQQQQAETETFISTPHKIDVDEEGEPIEEI
jgi:hypothetical protein